MADPEDSEARVLKLWAASVPEEYRPGLNPTERGPGHGGIVVPDGVKKGSIATRKKGK